MTRPICPECYRLAGPAHHKYEILGDADRIVPMCRVADDVYACPQCGFECLPPEEPKCRACGCPATHPGQLCGECAAEIPWNVVTPAEDEALEAQGLQYHVLDLVMYFPGEEIDWDAREYEYHERWLGPEE